MPTIDSVQTGTAASGLRGHANVSVGRFGGVELRPADVDEIGFQSVLKAAIQGKDQAHQARNAVAVGLRTQFSVHNLSLSELARQAKVSGNERDVHRNALQFVRRRQLKMKPRLQPFWKQAGRSAAMRQYLGLQKLRAALSARAGARGEAGREQAEQDFFAAMAPVRDNPGNAAELAQRFYDALGHDEELEELLSGFEPEARERLMEELRGCDVVEEYDHEKRSVQKGYRRDQFSKAMARALGLERFRFDDGEVEDFQQELEGQLAEMEADDEFGPYSRAALNIVSVAEEVQRAGEEPSRFIDDYDELVHGPASWADKCRRAAQLYITDDGRVDLDGLRKKMQACSQAANLDMNSVRRSAEPAHLWAAIQSAKLLARLTTAVSLAEQASTFFKRHFGRAVNSAQLLRELLERMASPRSPAQAFLDLANRLNLADEVLPSTLKQAADFFRNMHDMYPDETTRQALLENVLLAMDEAARMEDERLADEASIDEVIPLIEPARPDLPRQQVPPLDTPLGQAAPAQAWTGSKAR